MSRDEAQDSGQKGQKGLVAHGKDLGFFFFFLKKNEKPCKVFNQGGM